MKQFVTLKLENGSWIAHLAIPGNEIDIYGENKEYICIAAAAVLTKHYGKGIGMNNDVVDYKSS